MPEETKLGISETKEALAALGAIAVVARKAYRDANGDMAKLPGAFATGLMTNPEAMAAVKVGFDGVKQVPAELKDLDAFEALELAETAVGVIRKSFVEVQS